MKKEKFGFLQAVWIFTIGSVLGYIGECAFYVLKYHSFVNKQGMIIGPFKPMYGLALLFATLIYKLLKANKKSIQFVYGIIFGALFEYFVSFILEKIWGIYMWDYSTYKLNINGRVYLPYCIIWGTIGLIYYSYVYPLFIKLYRKYNGKLLKTLSIILASFILIDSILTCVVFFRIGNKQSNNHVYKTIDIMFPQEKIDSRLSKVRLKK